MIIHQITTNSEINVKVVALSHKQRKLQGQIEMNQTLQNRQGRQT